MIQSEHELTCILLFKFPKLKKKKAQMKEYVHLPGATLQPFLPREAENQTCPASEAEDPLSHPFTNGPPQTTDASPALRSTRDLLGQAGPGSTARDRPSHRCRPPPRPCLRPRSDDKPRPSLQLFAQYPQGHVFSSISAHPLCALPCCSFLPFPFSSESRLNLITGLK